jgi:IS30 family transposase
MLRLKALFRARAIPTRGTKVYQAAHRGSWLAHLAERGVRFLAETLYRELDVLTALRPKAKAAMLAEARRDPADAPAAVGRPLHTGDNGVELGNWQQIEGRTGAAYYLATPYHAWEGGTNENTNGRPRKGLGYRTPEECYEP